MDEFYSMCDQCREYVRDKQKCKGDCRDKCSIDTVEATNAPHVVKCHYRNTMSKEGVDKLVKELMERPASHDMLSALKSAPITAQRPVLVYVALSRYTRGPSFPRDKVVARPSNSLCQSKGCQLEAVDALLRGSTTLKLNGSASEGPTRKWLEMQLDEGKWIFSR
jgi:hypothetical protein